MADARGVWAFGRVDFTPDRFPGAGAHRGLYSATILRRPQNWKDKCAEMNYVYRRVPHRGGA